jgi:hypothetical protein
MRTHLRQGRSLQASWKFCSNVWSINSTVCRCREKSAKNSYSRSGGSDNLFPLFPIFIVKLCNCGNPDRSVDIASEYGLDGRRKDKKIFLYSTASRKATTFTQRPIQWKPGSLSHMVKQLGLEADRHPLLRLQGFLLNWDLVRFCC